MYSAFSGINNEISCLKLHNFRSSKMNLFPVPPGDQGWFCKYCVCKMEILEAINAHLGTSFSVESSWEDIFKEAITGPGGVNTLDPSQEWPSEDSEDDDYNPETNSGIEDDVSDDDSTFSSIFYSSNEGSSESRRSLKDDSDDTGDHATKSYKRQRRDVDYKQLYAEMFGKDQNENEQSEDEDWGPHRRKQRRWESNDPTDLGSSGDADRRPKLPSSRNEKNLPSTLGERKPLFRIPRDAVERLRQVFAKNELPSRVVKEELSKQLGLTAEKVSRWFKNARYAALRIRRANNYFDDAKFSIQACSTSAPLERIASKGHPFHCASETRDNEHLYLNEMERLCNLQEKIMKLKMALGASKDRVTNEPQSGKQPVIYVPVAEVMEKA